MKITNLPTNPELRKNTEQVIGEHLGRIRGCFSVSEAMETLNRCDLIISIEAIKRRFPSVTNKELCALLGY
jgi:hypothetical protein